MNNDQIKNNSGALGDAGNLSTQGQVPPGKNQLINEKGEKYLREAGKIEDYPDQDDREANKSPGEKEEEN